MLEIEGTTKYRAYSIGLALIAGALAFNWGISFTYATSVELQLFNLDENAQQVTEFPYGQKYVIALVSETEDLTKLLPITVRVRHSRVDAQDRIPADPEKYCKDIHVCALQGPVIMPKGQDTAIEITAKDKDGNLIATFSQGTVKERGEASPTPTLPQPGADMVKDLPQNLAPPFWSDPYVVALAAIVVVAGIAGLIGKSTKES